MRRRAFGARPAFRSTFRSALRAAPRATFLAALRAALLAALVASVASPALAQDAAPRVGGSELAIIVGGGGAFAGSQGGVDRDVGPLLLGGIELRQPWRSGFAGRLALRLEGGFTSQGLSSSSDFVDGDAHTVHVAALLSAALMNRGRFESYALAGPAWSRASTKLVFDAPATETPGAEFEQTTHETAWGAVLGVGAGWRIRSAAVRLEARWMSIATTKSTTMVPVVLSVAVPLHFQE